MKYHIFLLSIQTYSFFYLLFVYRNNPIAETALIRAYKKRTTQVRFDCIDTLVFQQFGIQLLDGTNNSVCFWPPLNTIRVGILITP